MRSCGRFVLLGLFVAFAARAADASGCGVRKGLYDSWLSSLKRAGHSLPKGGALVAASTLPAPDSSSAQEIGNEYLAFFECLSETAIPSGEDGPILFCKGAAGDRLAALVCQAAVYLKTGRTQPKELIDALPPNKKGAEMIWELETIAEAGAKRGQIPTLFLSKGPSYKIIDELFVLVLDDQGAAAMKYFNIVGGASGSGERYVDSQIKILLRESPAMVVKQWEFLRQFQPKVRRLLAELATESSAADMKKLREGVASFCAKDNLDCPEILKVFGRP